MRKLRAQTWRAGATIDCLGHRFGIRVTEPAWLPTLLDAFPPSARFVAADAPAKSLYSVVRDRTGEVLVGHVGPQVIARASSADEIRREIVAHVDTVLAVSTPGRVFVHAGVVASRGRAILLPGASYAGKSSLVNALLDRGLEYYSDDMAVLDGWGRVHPYPRPLSLRTSARPGASSRGVSGGRLASTGASRTVRRDTEVGRVPVPVSLIVFTAFETGAAFAPTPMSGARAALGMLGHARSARHDPQLAMRILGRVARRAPAFEGRRGEAAAAADALLGILQASARPERAR